MAGALCALAAGGSLVTVGTSEVEIAPDPKTGEGGGVFTLYGYGSGFGAISPTSWAGFPIVALYQAHSERKTVFAVTGDASALSPVLRIDGASQGLGGGAFSGGITTFQTTSTVANPFSGHATVNWSIG
jgi:hypothetical protein